MGLLMNIRAHFGGSSIVAHDGPAPPDRLPAEDDDFAELVRDSLDELPAEYLRALEHVPVLVADDGMSVGAYGLYHGGGVARSDIPAQIIVYRDTLVRDFGDDPDRLAAEIRRTVRHELAHHLGFAEAGVHALGL